MPNRPTIVGVALIVYPSALAVHELGHVFAALALGVTPRLVSTTDAPIDLGPSLGLRLLREVPE